MNISQKCQYALRALFELAKHYGDGPTTVAEVARVQAIPPKFLELILGSLRQGGFVRSRRGSLGGYMMALTPESLTVGEIIRFVDGPLAPVRCVAGREGTDCPLHGRCAFMGMWCRARDAMSEIYDNTTFRSLIEEEAMAGEDYVGSYCI